MSMEMTFVINDKEYTVTAPDAITGLAMAQELAAADTEA
jgi:hypothetical protein